VYGAATATILLTRSMAWFATYATGWDYMVPVTGRYHRSSGVPLNTPARHRHDPLAPPRDVGAVVTSGREGGGINRSLQCAAVVVAVVPPLPPRVTPSHPHSHRLPIPPVPLHTHRHHLNDPLTD